MNTSIDRAPHSGPPFPAPAGRGWVPDPVTGWVLVDQATIDLLVTEKAENTQRAYRSAFGVFQTWCAVRGVDALPATSGTVADYITHMTSLGRSASTIRSHVAAISMAHRLAGEMSPTTSSVVKAAQTGAYRAQRDNPIGRAKPVSPELLTRMVQVHSGDSCGAVRNRALLVFGWHSALRRSELCDLQTGDVDLGVAGFVSVTIRHSKTDQTGQGQQIVLAGVDTNPVLCPRRTLEALIGVVPGDGAVFRGVTRYETWRHHPLNPQAVTKLIQTTLQQLEENPAGYTAHSLRAGWITWARQNMIPDTIITTRTRHRNTKTLDIYTRPQLAAAAQTINQHPL